MELITTGKVAEFKPPEAPKTDDKPTEPTATATTEAKPEGEKPEAKTAEQARDDKTGQFKKTEGEKPSGDEDDDADLPERVRRQIGKKHRRMMEAEEFARERDTIADRERKRAEAAERELERIRGGKSSGPSSDGEGGSDPDEPKPGDFKTVGEYTRALIKYEAKKAGEVGRAKAAEHRQQEQANQAIATFVERQDAFRAANPDYDEIVGAADIEVPPMAMQYLVESEAGPALTLYLAKNPAEITRLSKLSPSRQLAELGKLEVKLEAKPAPAPNGANGAKPATSEVSRAPAPITPLEAKTTPVHKDPSQMSVQELRAFRRQEQEARAKSGR